MCAKAIRKTFVIDEKLIQKCSATTLQKYGEKFWPAAIFNIEAMLAAIFNFKSSIYIEAIGLPMNQIFMLIGPAVRTSGSDQRFGTR